MAGSTFKSSFITAPAADRREDLNAFPQEMISALQAAVTQPASDIEAPATSISRIPLDKGLSLIAEALEGFDQRLGAAAREFLAAPERLNLRVMLPEEKGVRMRVRVGGLEQKDAMSFVGHKDYEALKKEFPIDHNDKPYSIVDFQYDGSVKSVIYLAHEMGHAIADDYQKAAGNSYRDNPKHMEETQAYIVQSMVTAALMSNADKDIAAVAKAHFAGEMAMQLNAYPLAQCANDALQAMAKGAPVHPAVIFENRFGEGWEKIALHNPEGLKVFTAMVTEEKAVLQTAANRVSDRPASQLLGAGLADYLAGQSLQVRAQVLDAALGLDGPKTITDVINAAGFTGAGATRDFAERAVDAATAAISPGAGASDSMPETAASKRSTAMAAVL